MQMDVFMSILVRRIIKMENELVRNLFGVKKSLIEIIEEKLVF